MSLIQDSNRLVAGYVKGKKVLLCGAAEEPPIYDRSWAKRLKEAGAQEIVGVDRKSCSYPGVTSITGDVETCELGGPYDVIFAGKVFNHLGNPQAFVERAKQHLKKNGRLIIKTPNAGSLQLTLLKLARLMKRSDYSNHEHVLWHDPYSLEGLLKRCGYTVTEVTYVQSNTTWKLRALNSMLRFRPELAEDFVIVAEPKQTLNT